MGKTKIKIIDESKPKETAPKKKLGRTDDLVEKLKAELESEKIPPSVIATPGETTPEAGEARGKQSIKEIASSSLDKLGTPRNDNIKTPKKLQSSAKTRSRSKKYQQASKDLDRSKSYLLPEAVDIVRKLSYTKFNGTLEAHINTIQTGIRGLISLPFASGRKLRILAFGPVSSKDLTGLEDVTIGTDETIEQINKGKVDFDLVVTTPEWIPKLAKVARILGPRGLMPNPKNGTITDDLKKAVAGFQGGKTEYKTESKAPVVHLGLGKLDQPNEELIANIKTILQTLGKTRVKKVSLSPTMGPSVRVDLASI